MKIPFILFVTISIIQITYAQNSIEVNYQKKDDNTVQFFYNKEVPGSYFLTIEFTRLDNCTNNRTFEKVIKGKSGSLFTLKPINANRGISFSYNVKYVFGDPDPGIRNDIHYLLPFKSGNSVKILEASNLGEQYFGSEKPLDWKSFVVFSEESDTICSMRKGKVVRLIDEYEKDLEFNKSYSSKRNEIIIEHEDGTYAAYKGFDKNQIFVKLDQDVYPHTSLGKLEKFNKNQYRLDFSIFHYLPNLLNDKENTLQNINYKIKYLNPDFYVDNDIKKIGSGKFYTSSFKEDIKTKEFSRREKRKYKKAPDDFK
jgi:hypothetical protein